MKLRQACIGVLLALCTCSAVAQQTAEEVTVWKLEYSYWQDVKTHDLAAYRALWHEDFVGWPYVSSSPQRKDHITDWIDHYSAKGLRLKSYSLQPAASHETGNNVLTYYWLTAVWEDKSGRDHRQTQRIAHTWLRTPTGWQILGGMSAQQAERK